MGILLRGLIMGAFWNPYGGIVVSDKKLKKKEVSQLKRKWSEQPQSSGGPFNAWWKKIKSVLIPFSRLK